MRGLIAAAAALALIPAQAEAASVAVQITNLTDLTLPVNDSLSVDATATEHPCITTGLVLHTYSVTAGDSGGFFLTGGGGKTMPFDVQWSDSGVATSGYALKAGQPLMNQNGGLLACATGSPNATLIVSVRTADLQAATNGTYTGSLSLLISAN